MAELLFEPDAPKPPPERAQLVLDLDGFEGPIDVLLTLAREQKVDLARIKIVPLADQYLAFIAEARRMKLELAADYLVMAAWLAFLKSRLLLPEDPRPEDAPSGEEMAANLAFQLRRLEAMQNAGKALMALPRLSVDTFARGATETTSTVLKASWQASLHDLLKAYGEQRSRGQSQTLRIAPTTLHSVEEAIQRLSKFLGNMPDWQSLSQFLPQGIRDPVVARSAMASTFVAALELAKEGRLEVRQASAFGPIHLRSAAAHG